MKLQLTDLLLFFWSINCNLLGLTAAKVGKRNILPCPQTICKHPGVPHATWLVLCKKFILTRRSARDSPAPLSMLHIFVGGFLVRFSIPFLCFFLRYSHIFFFLLMPCARKYILLSACFEYSWHIWLVDGGVWGEG